MEKKNFIYVLHYAHLTNKILFIYKDFDLQRTLYGHRNSVSSVAFDTSNMLASGSYDTTIKLWNKSNGALLRTLTGHASSVWSVAFDTTNILASGSYDKSIKL